MGSLAVWKVGTYDQFRDTFRKWGITNQFTNVFWSSMASGLLFAGATMPLETAKVRCATASVPPPISSPSPFQLPPFPSPSHTHIRIHAQNRMAFQKADPITGVLPYRGTSQAVLAIAREGGVINGLYAGFLPYYIRCVCYG